MTFSKLRLTFVCLILVINCKVFAKNYYIDPSSNTGIQNGTWNNPWTSMNFWNSSAYQPGDTIFIKRGQTYPGDWYLNRSGTSDHPIVYTGYGEGSSPKVVYSKGHENAIHLANVSYVVIDGINITDPLLGSDDGHNVVSNIHSAIYLESSTNCTIKKCDMSLVGAGVSLGVNSNYNTITNNHIYSLRMVIKTPTYINANDDHGANGIGVSSSNNTISYNKFEDNWAISYDYQGIDGGVVEFYGTTDNNQVIYNTCSNCSGFLEIGSPGNGSSNDNVIAYNKIVNCGDVGYFHCWGQGFGTDINNIQFYNNVIVNTANPYTHSLDLFGSDGTPAPNMLVLKNNIFFLTTGMNFTDGTFAPYEITHTDNIYHIIGGVLNIKLNSSETLNNGGVFVDTTGDAYNWDFDLLPGNTVNTFGTNIGISKDFNGKTFKDNPGIGIYAYNNTSSNTELKAKSTATPINCHGDSASVTVNATGGTAPYNGTGIFRVNAGSYNYTVTDAKGLTNITSITINQPDVIAATVTAGVINILGGSTIVSVSASGGVVPYTYSLNGTDFQTDSTFTNVLAGTYSVLIKDANGCTSTHIITVNNPGEKVNTKENFSVSAYPNPSNNYFTISISNYTGKLPAEITVFNLQGGIVYKSSESNANNQYKFGNDFLPATYLLHVKIGEISKTLKLVKP